MKKNSKKFNSKKHLRKLTSMLLALTLIFSVATVAPFTVSAAETSSESVGVKSGDFEYELLEDETAEITGYGGTAIQLTIPSSIDGYTVTSIGWGAFEDCTSLASVTIPDGVTSIGGSAFSGCTSLASITIPDSVTSIGSGAFWDCTSLASITIPDSVTSIGSCAFYGCTSLASITIPDSVTSIGLGTFEDCTSLASVTIPDSVTNIGEGAFRGCTSLANATIPDSVTSICEDAFSGCTSLASITIPDSVKDISVNAFCGCTSLASINVGNENQYYCGVDGVLFKKDKTSLITYPAGIKSKIYSIPNSVTSIGENAFSGCTSLASVIIPDSVTEIGDYAFCGCGSLASVTIADGVTNIGAFSFLFCTSLASVKIGNSVTSIGENAFGGCTNLASVTIPDSVTEIGWYAFSACTSLASVTIGNSVTEIGWHAFSGCTSLANVTIGNSVTKISWYAFSDCTSLKAITLPDSVTKIGSTALGYQENDSKPLDGFTIYGKSGSAAETYANENKFTFVDLDNKSYSHADETSGIKVVAKADADLSVTKTTDEQTINNVKLLTKDKGNVLDVYDISLQKDGKAVQHEGMAEVTIPCNNENVKVYRVEADDTLTDMNAVYKEGNLHFYTEHFSLYALVVSKGEGSAVIGDVNGDGDITILDATAIQKHLARLAVLTDEQLSVADTNGDGEVTILDVTEIQKYLAKLVPSLG